MQKVEEVDVRMISAHGGPLHKDLVEDTGGGSKVERRKLTVCGCENCMRGSGVDEFAVGLWCQGEHKATS